MKRFIEKMKILLKKKSKGYNFYKKKKKKTKVVVYLITKRLLIRVKEMINRQVLMLRRRFSKRKRRRKAGIRVESQKLKGKRVPSRWLVDLEKKKKKTALLIRRLNENRSLDFFGSTFPS